jgi:hypothetical protein
LGDKDITGTEMSTFDAKEDFSQFCARLRSFLENFVFVLTKGGKKPKPKIYNLASGQDTETLLDNWYQSINFSKTLGVMFIKRDQAFYWDQSNSEHASKILGFIEANPPDRDQFLRLGRMGRLEISNFLISSIISDIQIETDDLWPSNAYSLPTKNFQNSTGDSDSLTVNFQ